MAALLGDEFPAFLTSYDAPTSIGLRVNTLKIGVDAFCALAPFALAPIPWCPAGFTTSPPTPLLRGEGREPPPSLAGRGGGGVGESAGRGAGGVGPGKHPYHAAGLYYLQDPSAMAAAELLDPQPDERVLDLAAAPGGKATHIASLMANQGLLVANEIHPQRAWELAGNLERWGARNVAIANETPERLAERFPGFFDRVLVDAPCSGEGMMRKGEAARREWAPELVRGCALRQDGILEHAARLVRPGGRLVYATCTFNPEENEGTVARFLADHSDFALIQPLQHPGFSPGRPDWVGVGDDLASGLARAVRLWPHLAPGEGHFIAVLERSAGAPADPPPKPWRPAKLPKPAEDAYRAFCAMALRLNADRSGIEASAGRLHQGVEPPEGSSPDVGFSSARTGIEASAGRSHQGVEPPEGSSPDVGFSSARTGIEASAGRSHWGARPPKGSIPDALFSADLTLVGSYLYALPTGLPDLTGLRYLHPGWWLGTIRKDRFEPSHALALALRPEDARRACDLPADAPELAAYLRGETLTSPGEDGWTLVAVDGFPLGWGKRVGGRLKSHYPKGLRRST